MKKSLAILILAATFMVAATQHTILWFTLCVLMLGTLVLLVFVAGSSRSPRRFTLGPAGNDQDAAQSPEGYYRKAWELIRDNSVYQDRLGDWQAWEHKFDGRLGSIDDAALAIRQALVAIGDRFASAWDVVDRSWWAKSKAQKGVASGRVLPGNIGYVRLTTFVSDHTVTELRSVLEKLAGVDAYVLDLRGNPGGLVAHAMSVLSLVLDGGKLATFVGRRDGKRYEAVYELTATAIVKTVDGVASESPREANLTGGKPLIVLVDKGSASASELVSGALRDLGRARLLGTLTYGKGVAQDTWEMPYGTCLRLTQAHYHLPGGECVEGKGIQPELSVAPCPHCDVQLNTALKLLQQELPSGLPAVA